MSAPAQTQKRAWDSPSQMIFQFLVLAALVVLLINYKATSGLTRIHQLRTTGQLHVSVLRNGVPPGASALASTLAYLKIVWPALVFGVLISAAARTSLSRTPLDRLFGHGPGRDQLVGALAGAPLMLCSCCAAPIFPSIYRRSARPGPRWH